MLPKRPEGNIAFVGTGLILFIVTYSVILNSFTLSSNFLSNTGQFFFLLFILMAIEQISVSGTENFLIPVSSSILFSAENKLAAYPSLYLYILIPAAALLFLYYCKQKMILSYNGSFAAMLLGLSLLYFQGVASIVLLLFFMLSSTFIGTLLKGSSGYSDEKSTLPRDEWQVLSNGGFFLVTMICFVFNQNEIFLTAALISMAVSTSDTWASETGMGLKGKTIDVLTFKKISAGSSGGISLAGTTAGFTGALSMALLSTFLFDSFDLFRVTVITCFGFTGMLIDSFIGSKYQVKYRCATTRIWSDRSKKSIDEEQKGISWINNDMVNVLSNGGTVALYLSLQILL